MNILHTVESYYPSISGAPEVVRQVSERLARRGHRVTVATSRHPDRRAKDINGVHVEEFDIRGNAVNGFQGETQRYQDFLRRGGFDLMMSYAAQQWSADLTFPILDQIPAKKVLIPCGFSGLYWPAYAEYFRQLPAYLRGHDHLIFHADNYRDTNFARQHGLTHWSIIPNGASQAEFEASVPDFRAKHGILPEEPLLLTVGNHTGIKGHALVLEAFRNLKTEHATLVVIGDAFGKPRWWNGFLRPLLGSVKHANFARTLEILTEFALGGVGPDGCLVNCRAQARKINWQAKGRKKVLILNLPRQDVISAFHAADLFLFGSNIEYSPLVLYEAMASSTPFLTLACGNAAEIVDWSNGGGVLAPTIQKDEGFVDCAPEVFAQIVDGLLADRVCLQSMGEAGYVAWQDKFTWEKIATMYENLYLSLI